MARAIWWAVGNAAFAACLWIGFVDGVDGARSVGVFYVWFMAFCALGLFSEEVKAELRAKGPPVPIQLDLMFDLFVAGFLVWHGSWVLAIVYLFHTSMLHGAYAPRQVRA